MATILNCIVTTVCPFCNEEHDVLVNEQDYLAWQRGSLAQDIFDYLSASEREMLISGICPDCWDGMFSDEYDEEEDWGYNEDEGFDPYLGCYTGDC